MKLSIVICVYNTEIEYLTKCLKSITRSTLKELTGNYEICMVDDGSTIDYTQIVKNYGIKYIKTENRGICAARSTGLQMVSGEYTAFCDSDDTVSFNYHAPMLLRAEETDADIVINDWAFHTPNMRYYCKNDDLIRNNIDLNQEEGLLAFFKNNGKQHSFYVLWNKLYKTELLKKAFEELEKSEFPKDASYSEDAVINFFAWRLSERTVNIHTGFYFYRIHATQSVNATSEEKLRRQIDSMACCLDIMRKGVENDSRRDELLTHIQNWAELMSRAHYSQALENGYSELFDLIKERYRVKRLSKATVNDSDAYIGTVILGKNFEEIDACLFDIWASSRRLTVAYNTKDRYISRSIDYLVKLGKAEKSTDKTAEVTIPKNDVALRSRIVRNKYIYKLSLIFFKKGSRLRSFLKKYV